MAALAAKMKYSKGELVRLRADFLRAVTGSRESLARESLPFEFVETYMALTEEQETEFEELVSHDREHQEAVSMITTYEKRGKQEAVLMLLKKKFGFVNPLIEKRIKDITSPERLDSLLLSILDAQSVDDLDI